MANKIQSSSFPLLLTIHYRYTNTIPYYYIFSNIPTHFVQFNPFPIEALDEDLLINIYTDIFTVVKRDISTRY